MGIHRLEWLLATWLLALLSTVAAHAGAAGGRADPGVRAQALKLAGEAMDLYEAGDCTAALIKFGEADELVPAPTLELRMARCLDKLDRMQEAAAQYREVIAFELTRTSPKVHHQARKEAVPELAALLEQTPTITVVVQGAGSEQAVVTMNGEPFDAVRLGVKQAVDPAAYAFEARVGDRVAHEDLTVERGQKLEVALVLPEPGGAGGGGGTADAAGGTAMRVGGWLAIGVGSAGVLLGVIVGAVVLADEQDLLDRCPDRQCQPDAHDDAQSFNTMRTVSTVGFVAGGAVLALGVTLLLVAPGDEPEGEQAAVTPFLTWRGAGVRGRF